VTRIVVVGGGITGLAAAYELRRAAPDAELVLLEATDRLGGKILTTTFAGRPLDAGADAFLARVPAAIELCAELGLVDELVSPVERTAYVFSRGALHRLPDGLVVGVPTDLEAVARAGILTGPVPSVPCRPLAPGADVAVGALVRHCFGDEVATRLVDPLLGGINAGDSDRLSVRAVAPMLADAAEHVADHGGDLAMALGAARAAAPGGADDPVFLTHPGGLGRVIDTLAAALGGARVHVGTPALDLTPAPAGGWEVGTGRGAIGADGVVLTAPAFATAALVRDIAPGAARLLAGIAYASVVMVTFAFDAGALATPLDASGFLVPRPENLHLSACSWSSSKWAHLRDGSAIVRASAGRIDDHRALDLDDSDLVEQLLADLDTTMGVRSGPTLTRVSRWERSFPQYEPGHLERVAAMEADVAARAPGVVVAGAAQRGLGLPACVAQGRSAARALVAVLYAP